MCLIKKILTCNDKAEFITFVNPYSYYILRKTNLYNSFDAVHLDGFILVMLLNFFLHADLKRKSFDMTSMAKTIFQEAVNKKESVALIGSNNTEISKATSNIKNFFSGINIICSRSGYFSTDEKDYFLDELVTLAPSVVVVGMGTPLQEEFLLELRNRGWKGKGYTCGGFFHQTSKNISYYPKMIDRFNLRWLYRIYNEPKLFVRYFYDYPKALIFIFKDIISYKIKKN